MNLIQADSKHAAKCISYLLQGDCILDKSILCGITEKGMSLIFAVLHAKEDSSFLYSINLKRPLLIGPQRTINNDYILVNDVIFVFSHGLDNLY